MLTSKESKSVACHKFYFHQALIRICVPFWNSTCWFHLHRHHHRTPSMIFPDTLLLLCPSHSQPNDTLPLVVATRCFDHSCCCCTGLHAHRPVSVFFAHPSCASFLCFHLVTELSGTKQVTDAGVFDADACLGV